MSRQPRWKFRDINLNFGLYTKSNIWEWGRLSLVAELSAIAHISPNDLHRERPKSIHFGRIG